MQNARKLKILQGLFQHFPGNDGDSSPDLLDGSDCNWCIGVVPAEKLPEVVMLCLAGQAMQHGPNVFLIPTQSKCVDEVDVKELKSFNSHL